MSEAWKLPAVIESHAFSSRYTPEKMSDILDLVCEGTTVTDACKQIGIGRMTYYRWRNENSSIMKSTILAMDMNEEMILDQCMAISDNLEEHPDSRRVRVWTRLQILAKRNPERFGDKIKVTHDMQPVLEQLNAARARIIEHKG